MLANLGNPYYVQPFFVHDIVRRVKEVGGKPFLTDSNTYYHGATPQRLRPHDQRINERL